MDEDLNQKISQFIDNELDSAEALSLLKSLRSIPELNCQYNRYQIISQAIKTDKLIIARAGFVESISKKIQHEPVYSLPQLKAPRKIIKHIALAASILIVATITNYNFNRPKQQSYSTSDLQMTKNMQDVSLNVVAKPLENSSHKHVLVKKYLNGKRSIGIEKTPDLEEALAIDADPVNKV